MKHKHYDCIVAWAQGKQIQTKVSGDEWADILPDYVPAWEKDCEYRIKPEEIVRYLTVWYDEESGLSIDKAFEDRHNLKVTIDGNTHQITNIEGKF